MRSELWHLAISAIKQTIWVSRSRSGCATIDSRRRICHLAYARWHSQFSIDQDDFRKEFAPQKITLADLQKFSLASAFAADCSSRMPSGKTAVEQATSDHANRELLGKLANLLRYASKGSTRSDLEFPPPDFRLVLYYPPLICCAVWHSWPCRSSRPNLMDFRAAHASLS